MIESRGAKGKARVTFTVDPRVGARTAAVCGEWNDWSDGAGVMRRDTEGGFSLTVSLDTGGLTGSGISWTADGGTTTGPPTPMSATISAEMTRSWT